jgi:hypothetical protein
MRCRRCGRDYVGMMKSIVHIVEEFSLQAHQFHRGIKMNEKVLAMARELCITSEYLFDIAIEMAEEELGIGLYDE